ncbi:hypothetical protein R3I94_000269 [Phoxinus phoxinus]|uniref:Uncharacterized protein n=1 Tax=Phoxinus phoxinus TaxID=58324 RepID=A0AAN9HHQ6_9TELE
MAIFLTRDGGSTLGSGPISELGALPPDSTPNTHKPLLSDHSNTSSRVEGHS